MNYTDIIFTNHAKQKMEERGLSKNQVLETFTNPSSKFPGKKKDTIQYEKKLESYTITAIGKQNEKKEWIVVSVWRDPPLVGTRDYKQKQNWKKYKKSGFLGKIWISIKQQIGI